ncbi:diacylglycerol kinase [Campylobacter sp. VicNov18]|uniref:diacylglycerol kinase n=1 Tax=Campylobacter bilis TaxID=2691918 RepID=UPI00130ED229|nr:diacylglycerol kinase [Campylobacter bilis]MPV62931.1 diacylglycerol kinase [Campylobacter hepaticus]MBM0636430.1 diacylglycerol kinase [Campylobacter bilis]MCC8277139.1 diacylglycerol kinase [Campylobacter bilis]MCC8298882.1 diacylglycerol kinase [Campylobacter bilis]MCC8300048.1 diacylglycerol kinase [Campylobacter bilis]
MKPKYHFLSNAKYALEGFLTLLKNERAFQIELSIIIPVFIISFFLPVSMATHLVLISVLILILIAEAFNSAVEACVDLIIDEWHEKAKIAKDCASAGVLFSVFLAFFVWAFALYSVYL